MLPTRAPLQLQEPSGSRGQHHLTHYTKRRAFPKFNCAVKFDHTCRGSSLPEPGPDHRQGRNTRARPNPPRDKPKAPDSPGFQGDAHPSHQCGMPPSKGPALRLHARWRPPIPRDPGTVTARETAVTVGWAPAPRAPGRRAHTAACLLPRLWWAEFREPVLLQPTFSFFFSRCFSSSLSLVMTHGSLVLLPTPTPACPAGVLLRPAVLPAGDLPGGGGRGVAPGSPR